MTHKMSWLMILAVAVGGGVAGGYLMRGRTAPAGASDQAVLQRLERLEATAPVVKRELARAGAQMGVMALSAAAAAGTKPDPDAEVGGAAQLSAAEQAAKERAHYDRLDQLVRTGGGVKASAHLRKNIEAGRAVGPKGKGGELDVAGLDCSDALCRVEVRGRDVGAISSAGLRVLTPGMGPLTMRPYEKGRPLVFYLAAPGQDLPAFDF